MEILNKNRRKRSVIRIVLVGLVAVAAIVTVMANTHKVYKDQGKAELQECQQERDRIKYTLTGQIKDRDARIHELEAQVEDLEKLIDSPDEAQAIAEERMKLHKDEIDRMNTRQQELERDLNACRQQVNSLKNF